MTMEQVKPTHTRGSGGHAPLDILQLCIYNVHVHVHVYTQMYVHMYIHVCILKSFWLNEHPGNLDYSWGFELKLIMSNINIHTAQTTTGSQCL